MENDRLTAQCNGEHVGATIDSSGMLATGKHCIINSLRGAPRPAVKCGPFAHNCGEFILPAARALTERPYVHTMTLCV